MELRKCLRCSKEFKENLLRRSQCLDCRAANFLPFKVLDGLANLFLILSVLASFASLFTAMLSASDDPLFYYVLPLPLLLSAALTWAIIKSFVLITKSLWGIRENTE